MNKAKNHNTIYFLTTISVYLGLVIVGSSPQILATTASAKNAQSQSFELTSRTSSVFSKLKYKSNVDSRNLLPFVSSGNFKQRAADWTSQNSYLRTIDIFAEAIAQNDQVFVISHLPRASIPSHS